MSLPLSALGTNHQVSKDLKDLLERLLDKDPKRRLTLVEAASHDWVVGSMTRKASDQMRRSIAQVQTVILTVNEEEMRNAVTKKTDLDRAVLVLQAIVRMKRTRKLLAEQRQDAEPPDALERAASAARKSIHQRGHA